MKLPCTSNLWRETGQTARPVSQRQLFAEDVVTGFLYKRLVVGLEVPALSRRGSDLLASTFSCAPILNAPPHLTT